MKQTLIEHILMRLKQLGVKDVFGVPGDFSFGISDAICNDPELRWIGNSSELNAAYAADGYARIKGFAALATAFGVGELSALNGIAGSYTEHLPVFHLVGMPNIKTQRERRIVHHTLGNGEFDLFVKMAQPAACATAILTPENAVSETERLVNAAITHRRPVYLAIPADYANAPLAEANLEPMPITGSDPEILAEAVNAVAEKLAKAKTAAILAGYIITRLGCKAAAAALVEASNLPFATMFMDKTALDETNPQYIGMYDGRLMNPEVREFIEDCDCILNLGAYWTDLNTGAFTARIDPARMIRVMHHHIRVGHAIFPNIEMCDALQALRGKVEKKNVPAPKVKGLGDPQGSPGDQITPEYLYPRWEKFFRPGDLIIAETGNVSMGLGFALMPSGSNFLNQTLWCSIGWATPAALGAALAAPARRTILITGEGSHQMTVQEVGQFCRYGVNPIIFCLNNQGYLIERLLCQDPMMVYNDLAPWEYQNLPKIMGCRDWFTARVTTNGELDAAMEKAETCGAGAYIEVVTDKMAASPMAAKLHDSLQTLYGHK
ncbi:MAG: thiamine pyrophosphate-binding protein [Deltaproteobacteria bacterium]|nr:thiamine pyrophosphate-binding protein [Deltaproteobacteria bacterium]